MMIGTAFFSQPTVLVAAYRPPGPHSGFVHDFAEFLSHLVLSYDKVVILGDFNLHYENADDPLKS